MVELQVGECLEVHATEVEDHQVAAGAGAGAAGGLDVPSEASSSRILKAEELVAVVLAFAGPVVALAFARLLAEPAVGEDSDPDDAEKQPELAEVVLVQLSGVEQRELVAVPSAVTGSHLRLWA